MDCCVWKLLFPLRYYRLYYYYCYLFFLSISKKKKNLTPLFPPLFSSFLLPKVQSSCPHPSKCELYYVNRDTLFSFHKTSETFLEHMMALYVSSHYKNTPNDMMLMSDAPLHHLFVLLAPMDARSGGTMPEILTVLQVGCIYYYSFFL